MLEIWRGPHWDEIKVLAGLHSFLERFSSVQSLSHVWLFVTSWTAARQASLSITNSQSLLKLMSIESVMPSNRLILCLPCLLLPSIFHSIRVFSSESVLRIRCPEYWSSASVSGRFAAAAAAASLQSCLTLCDPIDGSPPGFPSLGFSRQEHWSGLPFPSPMHEREKWKWSRSVVSDSSDSMDCSLPGSSVHGIFYSKVLEWVAIAFSVWKV